MGRKDVINCILIELGKHKKYFYKKFLDLYFVANISILPNKKSAIIIITVVSGSSNNCCSKGNDSSKILNWEWVYKHYAIVEE